MTLTRRDVLTGAAVVVATGGSAALVQDGQPSPESNLTDPAVPSRAVPSRDEVRAWELRYNARYKAEHRARNQAILQLFENEEPKPMRVDHALAHIEAELAAAEGLVQLDHDAIAKARGEGFAAMRDGAWYDTCPYSEDHDRFMAWHAGYLQAQPQAVDRDPANRPRGYTPPSGYVCPLCDAPEGRHHTGPKRILTSNFGRGGPLQEACEDRLIVRRMPVQRPGATFT